MANDGVDIVGDDVVDVDDDDDCMKQHCHYCEYHYSNAILSPLLPLHSCGLHCSACRQCPILDLEQSRSAPQVGLG